MFQVTERIVLTLWVGGMWAVGYLAVPILFKVLDDRVLAGMLAGQMFTAMSVIGLVSGAVLLLGALYRNLAQAWRHWRIWALISMLILVGIGEFILQPQMAELKRQGLSGAQMQQFARLHGIASVLYLINSLLGLTLVAFGVRKTST